jgi:hypothetical protein
MIYLGSPYSSPDPEVRKARFSCAETAAFVLLRDRRWVYSPIVHCHELATKFLLPKEFEYWQAYNVNLLRRADEFYSLAIDGWEESVGLTFERKTAGLLGIPRFLMHVFLDNHDLAYSVERDTHEWT